VLPSAVLRLATLNIFHLEIGLLMRRKLRYQFVEARIGAERVKDRVNL
jgi:hypothetical protein